MKSAARDIAAIFFDLDGTLVDSAPDLVAAMHRLHAEHGSRLVDDAAVASVVSKGGRAMLRKGFPDADEARIEVLLPRFLDLYSEKIVVHSRTYPGVEAMLDTLGARLIPWGIVTNKPGWLARAMLAEMKLDAHMAALVSGDCLPTRKPDPATILRACSLAGVDAQCSVYVGDDARDVEAGRRAGTLTVAAAWGYLNGEDPRQWGADLIVEHADELLPALGIA